MEISWDFLLCRAFLPQKKQRRGDWNAYFFGGDRWPQAWDTSGRNHIAGGQAAAKELKVPHLGRLMLSNDPHGVHVESHDEDWKHLEASSSLAGHVG